MEAKHLQNFLNNPRKSSPRAIQDQNSQLICTIASHWKGDLLLVKIYLLLMRKFIVLCHLFSLELQLGHQRNIRDHSSPKLTQKYISDGIFSA